MENSLAESARSSVADARITSLATLAELAESSPQPSRFYESLVELCVDSAGAVSGCLWKLDAGEWRPVVESGVQIAALFGENGQAANSHSGELSKVAVDRSTTSYRSDAVDAMFLITHLELVDGDGLLEVVVLPRNPQSDVAFLQTASQIATEYARSFEASNQTPVRTNVAPATESKTALFDEFLLAIHREATVESVAFAVVNDGRSFVECDRMAIACQRGRKFEIVAVSGQTEVNQRSNAIQSLARLATSAAELQAPQSYPVGVCDSEFESIARNYRQESAAAAIHAQPLISGAGELIGVLISEWFSRQDVQTPKVAEITPHAALAIQKAVRQSENKLGLNRLFRLNKLVAFSTVTSLVAALCLVPAQLAIEATGELQPAERRNVFASRDAVVHKVLVSDGATVNQNTPLVELHDSDLEYEVSRIKGEILTTMERQSALDAAVVLSREDDDGRRGAESAELAQHLASLKEQLDILEHAQEQLVLRSPIDGEVMTWNPEELLASRPIRRGQILLAVADPKGDWILDLTVPDEDFAHIAEAQRTANEPLLVTFHASTEPGRVCHGRLIDVATTSETDELLGPVVRMTVQIERNEVRDLRPGIGVVAHVECGRRSVGYVWMRTLIDRVRGRVSLW